MFEKIEKFILKKPFSTVLIYLILSLLFILIKLCLSAEDSIGGLGSFGDYINGVTTPLIGITGIVLTYSIIKNQLSEGKQNEFRHMFQLLFESNDKLKANITFKKGRKRYKGHEAFNVMNHHMILLINNYHLKKGKKIEYAIKKSFWTLHKDAKGSFAPFMKNMHNCLKIIDNECESRSKKTYAHLFRSHLNESELIFILLNGIGDDKFEDFKKRIEYFTMLQDIKNKKLIEAFKPLYEEIAFDDTDN